MTQSIPKISFGTAGAFHLSTEVLNDMLDMLEKHDVKEIDTAYVYGSKLYQVCKSTRLT